MENFCAFGDVALEPNFSGKSKSNSKRGATSQESTSEQVDVLGLS
jgi:hypothetical protein